MHLKAAVGEMSEILRLLIVYLDGREPTLLKDMSVLNELEVRLRSLQVRMERDL